MASDKQNDKPVKQKVVSSKKTIAELFPNLPSFPDYEGRPRYQPLADNVAHLPPRSPPRAECRVLGQSLA